MYPMQFNAEVQRASQTPSDKPSKKQVVGKPSFSLPLIWAQYPDFAIKEYPRKIKFLIFLIIFDEKLY